MSGNNGGVGTDEIPIYEHVPLPVPVDDWVLEQLQVRSVSFEQIAAEALEAHPEAEGEGLADQITVALMFAYLDAGSELSFDEEWRRVPPISADEQARRIADEARRQDGWRKHGEVVAQMRAQSGPFYENSRDRSSVLSDAWRRAGGPREVRRVGGFRGEASLYFTRRGEPVTEAEWLAWNEWTQERERIRARLGVTRMWNSKSAKRGK